MIKLRSVLSAHFEILRILKKIFPKIKESRTRTSEERKEVYLNLAIVRSFNMPEPEGIQTKV